VPCFHAACPSRITHQSGQPDDKENDMTDTSNKPVDDSKEELTEAELDQVAGGIGGAPYAALRRGTAGPDVKTHEATPGAKTHTEPGKGVQPAASVGRAKGI
jgi:hypothetical protein